MFPEDILLFHSCDLLHEGIPERVPKHTIVDDDSLLCAQQDLSIEFVGPLERRLRFPAVRNVRSCNDNPSKRPPSRELGYSSTIQPHDLARVWTSKCPTFIANRPPGPNRPRARTHRHWIFRPVVT